MGWRLTPNLSVALFDLSHAGQEGYTMSVSNGKVLKHTQGRGTIALDSINDGPDGFAGVGRNSSKPGLTPTDLYSGGMGRFSLAFDGYLLNGRELRKNYGGENDAETSARFIADAGSFEQGVANLAEAAKGHFCLALIDERGHAYAARSPLGVRTLIYGEGPEGRAIASESRALSHISMAAVRDLEAGEIAGIDGSGLHTLRKLGSRRKVCSFLWAYYMMPDCVAEGISAANVRHRIGKYLGETDKQSGLDVDLACPVPDSGKVYEEGYAEGYGCGHAEALKKYQYAGRSYEKPAQFLRDTVATVKMTVVPYGVTGKRVVLLDDSIRRGTQIVRKGGPIDLLKSCSPSEIHVRICSPRNTRFCRCSPPDGDGYEDGMLAANRFPSDRELAGYLGVDSVRFIGLENFIECVTGGSSLTADDLCLGCYSGDFRFLE